MRFLNQEHVACDTDHEDKYWIRPILFALQETLLIMYNCPKKISICLPKRLQISYFFYQKWSGSSRRKEDRENRKTIRQNRPVAIQYALVKPKKDGTALLHSTNTPPTITRKYAFMVIPRINIKRLTTLVTKMQTRIKIKSNNKNKKYEVNKKDN